MFYGSQKSGPLLQPHPGGVLQSSGTVLKNHSVTADLITGPHGLNVYSSMERNESNYLCVLCVFMCIIYVYLRVL